MHGDGTQSVADIDLTARPQFATFDAPPGYIIPGLGRVTAVRRTHNGWVVVTEKGMIAPR